MTRAKKADAMVKADQAEQRISEWKGVFDDVLKDAPWAPVFNEKRFTYHSARLGGDPALFTDPIHIPVNYDYIFAKDVAVSPSFPWSPRICAAEGINGGWRGKIANRQPLRG